jgi:lipopolysaccharide/colanic/teichoic acid biosynthesis glycosyltransferase
VSRTQETLKRALDVAGAALVLLLCLPLSTVVALAIVVTLGRPVLFRQTRPGLEGRPFELVKFRTMRPSDPALPMSVAAALDGQRLTRLGRVLRALSLDEIPTLWNVLRGDMSLVGPRPLMTEYLDRYTPEQARRHEVRPGITGLAQVRGRNALSWEQKFAFDVWYVDHRSLALDLRILVATVWAVLRRHGITAEGTATAAEFAPPTQRPATPTPSVSAPSVSAPSVSAPSVSAPIEEPA